jgi:hypothetical protein
MKNGMVKKQHATREQNELEIKAGKTVNMVGRRNQGFLMLSLRNTSLRIPYHE